MIREVFKNLSHKNFRDGGRGYPPFPLRVFGQDDFPFRGGGGTVGQHWLLKQFSLNHPVEHIQKPKLPKLYVRVETFTSYFIINNQFVKKI